jgi:hypothetical protein
MKIAICLSGQSRVIEYVIPSILAFFSGGYEFDFFCHTWNYNTYKRKLENPNIGQFPCWWEGDVEIDPVEVGNIISRLNPKKYVIHGKEVLGDHRFVWDSLTYSMMYANHLKKQYEIENNFRYDFVLKTRYDTIFDPNKKFVLNRHADRDNYLDLYCVHDGRMNYEYNRINTSDTIIYGSSMAMDIVSDLYRKIWIMKRNERADDNERLGPGSSISDLAEDRNLRFTPIQEELPDTVYRKEMIPLDPLQNFQMMRDFNNSLYEIKYD